MTHTQKRKFEYNQFRIDDQVILKNGECGIVTVLLENNGSKVTYLTNQGATKTCNIFNICDILRQGIKINPTGEVYFINK